MILKTTKQDLLKAINAAVRAVPNKTNLPILECFLIRIEDGGKFSVTASDNDVTITAYAEGKGEGVAAINAKKIAELARLLPDGDVIISTENNTATLDWGVGNSQIPCFDVNDWPELPAIESEPFDIPCSDIADAIKHTLPHTDNDEMRPIMASLHFTSNGSGWECAASDSRTLSLSKFSGSFGETFNLPAKVAGFILGMMPTDGHASVSSDGKNVAICFDGITVRSKCIIGNFPKYSAVIPHNNDKVFTANISAFMSTIKRVSICANKANPMMKFTFDECGSKVEAQDLGFGVRAYENLIGDYRGDTFEIGFKGEFILRSLAVLNGEKFTIHLADTRKAALVTADGDNNETVIAPVQI